MNMQDFEDAIQIAAAEKIKASFIVTRNTRDFLKSKITAITPEKILSNIMKLLFEKGDE